MPSVDINLKNGFSYLLNNFFVKRFTAFIVHLIIFKSQQFIFDTGQHFISIFPSFLTPFPFISFYFCMQFTQF
jgi:hypothetical protein